MVSPENVTWNHKNGMLQGIKEPPTIFNKGAPRCYGLSFVNPSLVSVEHSIKKMGAKHHHLVGSWTEVTVEAGATAAAVGAKMFQQLAADVEVAVEVQEQ